MDMHYYILRNRRPVEVTMLEWAEWFGNIDNRRVAEDEIGGVYISTVFLGIDHRFTRGAPLLFETMIFAEGGEDNYQTRCSTWDQAVDMHKRAVEFAEQGMKLAEIKLAMLRPAKSK